MLIGCSSESELPAGSAGTSSEQQLVAAVDAYGVRPLLPGMMAPAFITLDADAEVYEFDPANRERPTIVAFYRGGWCPYCNLQLAELRELDHELVELGYELLFLSADRPAMLAEGSVEENPPFSLLSDSTMSISSDFGIAFRVADETVERYRGVGIDLADAAGADHRLLPVPSVFVIGTDGEIKFQYVNPDYRERIPGALLLSAARVFAEES